MRLKAICHSWSLPVIGQITCQETVLHGIELSPTKRHGLMGRHCMRFYDYTR